MVLGKEKQRKRMDGWRQNIANKENVCRIHVHLPVLELGWILR